MSLGGELLDRVSLPENLPGDIDALGIVPGTDDIAVRSEGLDTIFDGFSLALLASANMNTEVLLSESSPLPDGTLQEIALQYRGPGVSFERLLYDLHSGRFLDRAGIFLMDAAGLLLIALSITGLIVWLRPRA